MHLEIHLLKQLDTNCEFGILHWKRSDLKSTVLTVVSILNFEGFYLKKIKYLFNFLRDRETECKLGRGRERGRHRIRSRLQALSCQHRAQCGAQTREP